MPSKWLTIGEVAERAGVATSALRFYERQGIISSQRSPGGQRRYRRDVLRRVAFLRVAQKLGLSLEEVATALSELPAGRAPTKSDWAKLGRSWQGRLEERIALLQRLHDDLTSCIGCGCLSLRACALYNPGDRAAHLGNGPRYLLGNSSAEVVGQGDV